MLSFGIFIFSNLSCVICISYVSACVYAYCVGMHVRIYVSVCVYSKA